MLGASNNLYLSLNLDKEVSLRLVSLDSTLTLQLDTAFGLFLHNLAKHAHKHKNKSKTICYDFKFKLLCCL